MAAAALVAAPYAAGGIGLLIAKGQLDAGDAAARAGGYRSQQYRINAGQARAAGQQVGEEELRKSELMQSRILALAGASGGGAMDPTVVSLMSKTAAEGKLAQATRIYNSEEQARGMEMQADTALYEGKAAKVASRYQALGTLLSTASIAKGFA